MAKKNAAVQVKAPKGGSVFKTCNCKSEYQDQRYGKQVRVMNVNNKGGASCTVCGSVVKF